MHSIFYGCSGITTIKIPNLVEEIGASAFYGCSKLSTITLPKGFYTTISNSLFQGCTALREVSIPTSVNSIGDKAFYGCSKLATVSIPTSVTSIGEYAFYNCSVLKEAKALSVSTIGSHAYQNCIALATAEFPEIESIGSYAFDGCKLLATIGISKKLTVIGDYGFQGCSSLTAFAFSNPLYTIGTYAFSGCSSLKSVVIPNTVTKIGAYAFSGCTSLLDLVYEGGRKTILRTYATYIERVTIPEGITKIVDNAFNGCSKLESIILPSTLTSVTEGVFGGCTNLKSLTYAEGTTQIYPTYITSAVSVTLPSTALKINDNAFNGFSELKSIVIPDAVSSIGLKAFYGCSRLAKAQIGSSVTSIGSSAFYGCAELNNIVLPAALTSIGTNAFANCTSLTNLTYAEGTRIALRTYATALTTLTIPSSVKAFADNAFSSCNSLSRINISSLEMWNYIYLNLTADPFACPRTLYLDGSPLTELIADFGRPVGNYAFSRVKELRSVTLGHSITGVNAYAFQNCPDLESLVIGNSCEYLETNAFTNCVSLQSVKFGRSVTRIGNNAFSGCTELNSVKMGGNEQTLGNSVFKGCAKLSKLDIPSTVLSIGSEAFSGCFALEEAAIPAGVTAIKDRTFYDCHNLQAVTGSDGVASVGQSAFYNCDRLKEITFGDALATISSGAFSNCDSLRYIYLGTGLKTVGSSSFSNCKDLTGFYCGAVDVPTCNSNAFDGSDISFASLYVPDESKLKYSAATPWKGFVQRTLSDAPVFVSSITIEPNVLVLEESDMMSLSAVIYPSNASNQRLTWSSSNANVIYVNNKGVALANMEGIATITCSASDGHGAKTTCTVIVCNDYIPISTLTLDETEVPLTEGEEHDLTASLSPGNATHREVVWTSSDERIAVVNSIGRITALRKGECIISCLANDGSGLRAQCHVTVNEPVYASLTVIGDVTGDGKVLKSDLDAVTDLILKRRDGVDINMADVNGDGEVTVLDLIMILNAIKTGSVIPVGKLLLFELTSDQYDMLVGDTLSLDPILVPYRGASNISWSSSDESVASVNNMGCITANSVGIATISGVATDESGLSVSCLVIVDENPYGITDGYRWVDLGLPSGTRWATMNIGASTPENAGYYLAWGETAEESPKDYTWATYTYSDGTATTLNKYCTAASYGTRDKLTELEAVDDAAHELWSDKWIIPSQEQWAELVDGQHTKTEWTSQNGVYGLKVTSKVNGYSLFLPAAGYYSGTKLTSGTTGGYYSSRNLGSVSSKNGLLNFGESILNAEDEAFRCYGQSIRPVLSTSIANPSPKLELDVEQEYLLEATVSGSSSASVIWRSSNSEVATVDQQGHVTPLAYGQAKIYAVLADANEITAHWDLVVRKPVVTLSDTQVTIQELGNTFQLKVTVTHNSGNLPVSWESGNKSIVTVSADGLLTAVGAGKTTITATANGVVASCEVTVTLKPTPDPVTPETPDPETPNTSDAVSFNGHAYVDLGLKDSQGRTIYWATCNVGADKPEDEGSYFAWGETVGYTIYTIDRHKFDWWTYKWCNGSYNSMTKYCTSSSYGKVDNKKVLDPEDDAAHVNWGGDWRMPTYDELNLLKTKCTWTWDSTKHGYTVKGPNGNSLFLPAAGYRFGSSLNNAGSGGYYWSSSLRTSDSDCAYCLGFDSDYVDWDYYIRCYGRSVRAVCVAPK